MKFLLVVVLSVFSTQTFSASCKDIPAGVDGKKSQTFRAVTGSDNKTADERGLGDDVVYEGAPCPAGKVCLETLMKNIGADLTWINGQVIVIDKATGNVEKLEPIALTGKSRKGIAFSSPARKTSVCRAIHRTHIDWFNLANPGANVSEASLPSPCADAVSVYQQPYIDMNSYNYYNGCPEGQRQSAFKDKFCAYSPEAKARGISILNSGVVTRPGQWEQAGSVQAGGAVTFKRVAEAVGKVRRALGCDSLPKDPRARLSSLLIDQAKEFTGCYDVIRGPSRGRFGEQLPQNDAQIDLRLIDSPQNLTAIEDVARPEAPVEERRGRRKKKDKDEPADDRVRYILSNTPFKFPANCTSVQTSTSVETITCESGPLEVADPNATRAVRANGKEQNKLIVRIVDGKIENLNIEKNYAYLSDYKRSCTPVPQAETGGAPSQRNNGSATQQ